MCICSVVRLLAGMIVMSSALVAQQSDDRGIVMMGVEAMPSSGRAFAGVTLLDMIVLPVGTFSGAWDRGDSSMHFSMNPLFAIPLAMSVQNINPGPRTVWQYLSWLCLPYVIGNLGVQLPVVPGHVYLTAAQRTDFYLFQSTPRIYTESALGLKLAIWRLAGEVRYTWPITRGHLESKGPYIGIGLYYIAPATIL